MNNISRSLNAINLWPSVFLALKKNYAAEIPFRFYLLTPQHFECSLTDDRWMLKRKLVEHCFLLILSEELLWLTERHRKKNRNEYNIVSQMYWTMSDKISMKKLQNLVLFLIFLIFYSDYVVNWTPKWNKYYSVSI